MGIPKSPVVSWNGPEAPESVVDNRWPVDDYGRAGRSAEATVAQLTISVRETVFPLRKGRGENGKNMMYMYICIYIYTYI